VRTVTTGTRVLPTLTRLRSDRELFAGVDTQADTHHAGVVTPCGVASGTAGFPASRHRYRESLVWMGIFGVVRRTGAEGTDAYGRR
jgi:hypothetical protein